MTGAAPTHRVHAPDERVELIAAMQTWDAGTRTVDALHAGDVGWAMREDPGVTELHAWWDGDDLAAVALTDGDSARPRLAPGRTFDAALAELVAAEVEALPGPTLWSDAAAGSALRRVMLARGWTPDVEDPWAALHLALDPGPGGEPVAPDDDLGEEAHTCVAERVEVQRRGFAGSTFTEEKWRRMAAGPAYSPGLDLLVRATDGAPAAAATAWLGPAGGLAYLEPVATHPDHRRAGHAVRVVRAAAERARRLGATGIAVATPRRNPGAVEAYQAAGLVVVETVVALTLGRAA